MEKPLVEQQYSSLLEQISSHPLFSILTTFFLLNLLYLPNLLLLLFSPLLFTTSIILTTLLHFASPRRPDTPRPHPNPIQIQLEGGPYELPAHVELHDHKTWSSMFCSKGGPLEVIYEENEGEELDEGDSAPEYSGQSPEYSHTMMMVTAGTNTKRLAYFGYGTSSMESDADSDDDESSSENNVCFFRWDEDEEGMIEIALEEDNLIEIDLSACR